MVRWCWWWYVLGIQTEADCALRPQSLTLLLLTGSLYGFVETFTISTFSSLLFNPFCPSFTFITVNYSSYSIANPFIVVNYYLHLQSFLPSIILTLFLQYFNPSGNLSSTPILPHLFPLPSLIYFWPEHHQFLALFNNSYLKYWFREVSERGGKSYRLNYRITVSRYKFKWSQTPSGTTIYSPCLPLQKMMESSFEVYVWCDSTQELNLLMIEWQSKGMKVDRKKKEEMVLDSFLLWNNMHLPVCWCKKK